MRPYLVASVTAALALLFAFLSSSALARSTHVDAVPEPVGVLLISVDGISPTMLGRGDSPHLDRLAQEGVAAAWMNPSYPSLTFPNHYSIVTGLRPDHHGVVHNTMRDADAGDFSIKDRAAVGDSRWWSGGEPLWVTAERAGLPTAVSSWPGSEAPVQGIQPTRWSVFDYNVTLQVRIDRVDGWLQEPPSTRPRLATLYFEHVDVAGHRHGPDSEQARVALRQVDAALGQLFERLRGRQQLDRLNVVVVSDHGMAEAPPELHITTESMVDPGIAEPVGDGAIVGFAPRPGQQAAAEAALLGTHRGYSCWTKQSLPAQWQYGKHPRIPAIVCQMDVGWVAVPQARFASTQATVRGTHGYALDVPEMRAIFLARGPAFRSGARVPVFDNVDLYPLLARLVGVPPVANDGQVERLAPALRSD